MLITIPNDERADGKVNQHWSQFLRTLGVSRLQPRNHSRSFVQVLHFEAHYISRQLSRAIATRFRCRFVRAVHNTALLTRVAGCVQGQSIKF